MDLDVREIGEIAASEGRPGLEPQFKSKLAVFASDRAKTEHFYERLRKVSPGAALYLALLLRANKLLISSIEADLEAERGRNPGLWTAGLANVLSPNVLARVREALGKGDTLCGLQRHYCAGSGPTRVVFNSFQLFEECLHSTRPGDEFMLVSVKQLAEQGGLLKPTAASVHDWLRLHPGEEVLLLKTELKPPVIENIWQGREEEEDLSTVFNSNQGLIAVPFTWEQKFFLDAKMPRDDGTVPLGGAY